MFLTKVIISQHLLNLLGDGVSIKLGRHCDHFLDAETRMTWYRQRGAGLRLPTRGILGQRLETGGLRSEWIPSETVDRLLSRTEG